MGDYVEADIGIEGSFLAHQLEIGYFIPPPEVEDTLIAVKFINNFPKDIIENGMSDIMNRATVQFIQEDASKPGTKANVLDVDLFCYNEVSVDTTSWTGFKSGPAKTYSAQHDPEFLKKDFSVDMLSRDQVDEEHRFVNLFDEEVPKFDELYYHKEMQEGWFGEGTLMMPCIGLFIVPKDQVNIKTKVSVRSSVDFRGTDDKGDARIWQWDGRRPITNAEYDFGEDESAPEPPKPARVVSEAFLKQKDASKDIQQSVNMVYKINEEFDLDDEFMFAFNLTMSTTDASPLESDSTVAQYISFRPKNTPTKWSTVVCETSMNITDYTGDAKNFKYGVTNFLSNKNGASLASLTTRDSNSDDGKSVFDGKVESQRDVKNGVFFSKQESNKKPYSKKRADGNGLTVSCIASIKLPKFAEDSTAVDKDALSGDLEFFFGVVNPSLAFPADKSKKDETKIGGITYEDTTIAAEITKKAEVQTQVFMEIEQKFDAYTPVSLSNKDAATSGKVSLKGDVFLSKDVTVPATLSIKAEVTIPVEIQTEVNKRIFQVWLKLKNLDNEFEDPAVATCYNDLNGISGVTVYGKDYDATKGAEKFEVNAKDCESSQTCRQECNGKDCLFAKAKNNDLYKLFKSGATHVTIPCIFTMKVQRDDITAATNILDTIFELDYGVNVFLGDKSSSTVLYKSDASEIIFLPYPYWNDEVTTAAGAEPEFGGFFNMAYSKTINTNEIWQQAGVEWFPSDYVKDPDVLSFYTIV